MTLKGNSWIRTFTGNSFDPLNPDPFRIRLSDIAHALSNTGRFSGHTTQFYSVAQHSVHVADILRQLGFSEHTQFEGLLHDATEAYLVDIPRPIKIQPFMQGYRDAEAKLEQVMAKRFKLTYPMADAVKQADLIALAMEARDLMGNPTDWEILKTVAPMAWEIKPWLPSYAKINFLSRFAELYSDNYA